MEEKKPNVRIDYSGEAFFCDAITVVHNPSKFVFDFKQTVPVIDQIENQGRVSFITRHKSVVMDPFLAKELVGILKNNIEKYEKQFGEIKFGKSPKKAKKEKAKVDTTEHSRYVG